MRADADLGVALARLERASRHHLAELWVSISGCRRRRELRAR